MYSRVSSFRMGAVALAFLGSIAAHSQVLATEPVSTEESTVFFRITQSQYENTISDIFGPIDFGGRYDPGIRTDGLLAIGSGQISVTSAGLEHYDAMARRIAEAVLGEERRELLVPCRPKSLTQPDDECARKSIAKVGRFLYRRPLTDAEVKPRVQVAATSATTLDDFYAGLGASLVNMLDSANFLFRQRRFEADPAHPDAVRMNAFSKAEQLSFFLWNTAPDDELLTAAETGELHSKSGLRQQVDRLINSPHLKDGVRAFFVDMLGFDEFQTLEKDTTTFPSFTVKVEKDAREETLRTIEHLLVEQNRDYRDLFTTRKTFLTSSLAALYGVPLVQTTPNGAPGRWFPYTYGEGDHRAGILTHASFVALHSHAGRSSPTLRGKALRELLMCQRVPPPPGDVDFSLVQGTDDPRYKTARERLTAHNVEPACAGCHKITDPIGLAFENFDSAGGYRKTEKGATIDPSGELNGVEFSDAAELVEVIHNDPAIPACAAKRLFGYGAGSLPPNDAAWEEIEDGFAADGYRVPSLMRQIALSDLFYSRLTAQSSAKQSHGD